MNHVLRAVECYDHEALLLEQGKPEEADTYRRLAEVHEAWYRKESRA